MQTYHGSLALACRGDGRDEGHEACEAVDHARRKGELSIAVRNYHGYLQELCSRAVGHGKPGVTTNLLVLQAVLSTATAATNRQAACSSPPTDSSHCTTSIRAPHLQQTPRTAQRVYKCIQLESRQQEHPQQSTEHKTHVTGEHYKASPQSPVPNSAHHPPPKPSLVGRYSSTTPSDLASFRQSANRSRPQQLRVSQPARDTGQSPTGAP